MGPVRGMSAYFPRTPSTRNQDIDFYVDAIGHHHRQSKPPSGSPVSAATDSDMVHAASASRQFVRIAQPFNRLRSSDPLTSCLAPSIAGHVRTYATTQTNIPYADLAAHEQLATNPYRAPASSTDGTDEASSVVELYLDEDTRAQSTSIPHSTGNSYLSQSANHTVSSDPDTVLTTLYSWPNIAPTGFKLYPSTHLGLPLRRDLLHRAVIFEGDSKRAGTASTKWRYEVRSSGRKIRPQKGSGRARLSDRTNPMIRGGGVAHGPKPRDFATELPKKIYDKALRTALSYRYAKGELIVLDESESGLLMMPEGAGARFLHNLFTGERWGQGNGRSLFVTLSTQRSLHEAARQVEEHLEVRAPEWTWAQRVREANNQDDGEWLENNVELDDVKMADVKSLLETGRVVIGQSALQQLFNLHSSDLVKSVRTAT